MIAHSGSRQRWNVLGPGYLTSSSRDGERGAEVADRTSTHEPAKVAGTSMADSDQAAIAMTDLKNPQPRYLDMIERGGYVELMEGMALSFDRATTDHVLRNHQLFSSRVEMGLGNVRPLIPLNVDPPLHAKYRKLLDPLFAPRRMDAQEADITPPRQRIHRRVHRPGGVQFLRGIR